MPVSPASGPLVAFYRGEKPDFQGRTLAQIRSWDNNHLEYVHDYIQWLFPLRKRSQFNPDAPVLDDDQIRDFRYDPALQTELIASFQRMAEFYGLEVGRDEGKLRVRRSAHWPDRQRDWLTPGNHNFLRITRILTSLRTLGLADEAHAFWEVLDEISRSEGARIIGAETYGFWRGAVSVQRRAGD